MTTARVDHLVVLAASLDEGAAWCESALGVGPGPGGRHPLMGTHNRLLRIATVDYPRAYLEIIAIDPDADPKDKRAGKRWFDMDDAKLAEAVAQGGPRLVHVVANVPDVQSAAAALAAQGIDRGPALRASRMTPRGLLEWQITVRDDGQRLFNGALPTLIEWGATHPAGSMPESGVTLQSIAITHPQAPLLRAAHEAIGLCGVAVTQGAPNLAATLLTPRGRVVLASEGL